VWSIREKKKDGFLSLLISFCPSESDEFTFKWLAVVEPIQLGHGFPSLGNADERDGGPFIKRSNQGGVVGFSSTQVLYSNIFRLSWKGKEKKLHH